MESRKVRPTQRGSTESTFCQDFEGGGPDAIVVPLQLLDAGCAAHMPLPRLPTLALLLHDLHGYTLSPAKVGISQGDRVWHACPEQH